MLPRLLHERLPELGIDLSVIYPSFGLLFSHFDDELDRRGACRALNRFNADVFAEFSDRLLPVAEIPMHTPADLADFLRYANGPADSEWGRRRAEDGHPEPYRLKYVELGNEEAVDEAYWRKFKPLAEAAIGDAAIFNNPRNASRDELLALFEAAF